MHDSRRGPDPVFVDRTGRRRRLFAIAGSAGGLVLILVVAALLAGFTGDGPATIPGWPTGGGHAKTITATRPPAPDSDAAGPRAPSPTAEPTVPATPVAAPVTTPANGSHSPATPTAAATRTPGSRRHIPTKPAPHPTKTH